MASCAMAESAIVFLNALVMSAARLGAAPTCPSFRIAKVLLALSCRRFPIGVPVRSRYVLVGPNRASLEPFFSLREATNKFVVEHRFQGFPSITSRMVQVQARVGVFR